MQIAGEDHIDSVEDRKETEKKKKAAPTLEFIKVSVFSTEREKEECAAEGPYGKGKRKGSAIPKTWCRWRTKDRQYSGECQQDSEEENNGGMEGNVRSRKYTGRTDRR